MNEKLIQALHDAINSKLASDVKADSKSGTFKAVITSEAIDRDGEVILLNGWDFDNFMKNPVVLRGHNYWDLPVAKATSLQVVNGQVIANGEFASEAANPKAQQVRNLYDDGFINAVSVGFRVLQRNPENRRIIEKQELLEFSFVTVPSNPEAMGLGKWVKAYMESSIMDEETKDGIDMHFVTYVLGKDVSKEDDVIDTPEVLEDDKVTLASIIQEIKTLNDKVDAKLLADGNAGNEVFLSKEALQEINRMSAEALRAIKLRK